MRSTGITVFTTRKSMKVFSRASTFYRKARTYCPCVKYGIFVMFKNLMKMIKYKYFCQEVLLLDWVFFLSFRSEITFSFFDGRLCMGGRLSTFSFFDGKALSGRIFVHLVIFWWEGSVWEGFCPHCHFWYGSTVREDFCPPCHFFYKKALFLEGFCPHCKFWWEGYVREGFCSYPAPAGLRRLQDTPSAPFRIHSFYLKDFSA